jgi:hypothetical protein
VAPLSQPTAAAAAARPASPWCTVARAGASRRSWSRLACSCMCAAQSVAKMDAPIRLMVGCQMQVSHDQHSHRHAPQRRRRCPFQHVPGCRTSLGCATNTTLPNDKHPAVNKLMKGGMHTFLQASYGPSGHSPSAAGGEPCSASQRRVAASQATMEKSRPYSARRPPTFRSRHPSGASSPRFTLWWWQASAGEQRIAVGVHVPPHLLVLHAVRLAPAMNVSAGWVRGSSTHPCPLSVRAGHAASSAASLPAHSCASSRTHAHAETHRWRRRKRPCCRPEFASRGSTTSRVPSSRYLPASGDSGGVDGMRRRASGCLLPSMAANWHSRTAARSGPAGC